MTLLVTILVGSGILIFSGIISGGFSGFSSGGSTGSKITNSIGSYCSFGTLTNKLPIPEASKAMCSVNELIRLYIKKVLRASTSWERCLTVMPEKLIVYCYLFSLI